ncbi:MAG: T9SS type A sorting domain-containing protein [Candidatus Heimdallarchaeota archaeon]
MYNTTNSGLLDDDVTALAIDAQGNKWIGTYAGGLAVYREGGVDIGVEEGDRVTTLITHFVLKQNYPNPFNPTTMISYQLPKGVHVGLSLYNLLGQKVRTLVDEFQLTGCYSIKFEADGLVSGLYFCRLRAGDFVETKRMLLLK